MIGKILWNEFFLNRDWPLASAVAVVMLVLLVAPFIAAAAFPGAPERRKRLMALLRSWRLISVLAFGYAFLYGPIALLIIYSFNESKLVTVWSGFSVKWYIELVHNEKLLEAAWLSLRIAFTSATLATVLGTLAAFVLDRFGRFGGRTLLSGMIAAPLVMPRGHYRIGHAAAVRRPRKHDRLAGRARPDHHHHRPYHLLDGLRRHRGAGAPQADGPLPRRGGAGPRRAAAQGVLRHHPADHRAVAGRRLAAWIHALPRRPG